MLCRFLARRSLRCSSPSFRSSKARSRSTVRGISNGGDPSSPTSLADGPVDRHHDLRREQAVLAGPGLGRVGDVVAEEVAAAQLGATHAERGARELGVQEREPVGDHRPAADAAEVRVVVPYLDPEVRAALHQRPPHPVPDEPQVVQDRRAVAEQDAEEAGVRHPRDRPVEPVADPVQRVHGVLADPELEQARNGGDEHERGDDPRHEQRREVAEQLQEDDRVVDRRRAGLHHPREERDVLEELQDQRQGERDGHDQGVGQQPHAVREPAQPAAPRGGDQPVVDVARDGGRAVPALAVRDHLPGLQRRRVAQLGAVAQHRPDVQHRELAHHGVRADRDRAGLDAPRDGAVAGEVGVLAHDGAGPDRQQVRAHRDLAREDDGARADPGAEAPQVHVVERRPHEHGERVGPQDRLHHPEAQVAPAPQGELLRPSSARPAAISPPSTARGTRRRRRC